MSPRLPIVTALAVLPLVTMLLPASMAEPKAKAADAKEIVSKTTGMKLVRIPAGKFIRGDENGDDDEKPAKEVTITKAFYLGKYEVTRGEFRAFIEDTKYDAETGGAYGWNATKSEWEKDAKYNWKNVGFTQADNHPVLNVSHDDAKAFCVWFAKKDGKAYRLPTEAEWEYACRAGTTTKWHSGDDEKGLAAVANLSGEDDEYKCTLSVGSFKPNAFGLYDMHGNVWEWCADWYDSEYYKNSPLADPKGPENGLGRVNRGGSWYFTARSARSSLRFRYAPSSRFNFLGFRVAEGSPSE